MYKLLAADLDELVVCQGVTPAAGCAISDVPYRLEEELRYLGFSPRRQALAPRVRGFKYELGRLDLNVHPAGRRVWDVEAFVDSASWHQERRETLLDVYSALECAHVAFGGRFLFPFVTRPIYVRSIAVHVDYTPFRCGLATRDRFVNRTRMKLQWNDQDLPQAGLHAGEFWRWYDKLAEVLAHPRKAYIVPTWIRNGLRDADNGVGRMEFTWKGRRTKTLKSFDATNLFRRGLDRISLMRKPRERGGFDPRNWNEDPLWEFLRAVEIPDALEGQFLARPRVVVPSAEKAKRDSGIALRAMGRVLAHTDWAGGENIGELEMLFTDLVRGNPAAGREAFDAARRERCRPGVARQDATSAPPVA